MRSVLHVFGATEILGSALGLIVWPMFLVFVALVAYVLLKSILRRKTDGVSFLRRPFLTKAEALFFMTLEKVAAPQYRVFAQVPLISLLNIHSSDNSKKTSTRNRLDRKTVDFVLVDPQTFEVRKVVELDDRSHDGQHRKDRDAFIDDVLGRAGIPIIHCQCKGSYDPASLRSQLNLPPVLLET